MQPQDCDPGDQASNLVGVDRNLPADPRPCVARLLDVLLIDDAHAMRQEVPLLEASAGALPSVGLEGGGEVQAEEAVYVLLRPGEILERQLLGLGPVRCP